MNKALQKEIKQLIKACNLNCAIDEFKDKVDWTYISHSQNFSEEFIREFKDKVNWYNISSYQKLSENFIREFKDKVNWSYISAYQKLSEDFIREFKDKVNWTYISAYQKLSENFIREFKDNFKKVMPLHNEDTPRNFKRIEAVIQKYEQEEQNKVEKENLILRKNKFKGNAILMLEI